MTRGKGTKAINRTWRRSITAGLVVFVVWVILDVVAHGLVLRSAYESCPQLWRTPDEVKPYALHGGQLISAVCFALLFGLLVAPKNVKTGAQFGALYGAAQGAAMGLTLWAVQPFPATVAAGWFVTSVVEAVAGGLLLGFIFYDSALTAETSAAESASESDRHGAPEQKPF